MLLSAALIPEGPLHPEHAVISLIVGLVVGGFVGRRSIAVPLVVLAAVITLAVRQPHLVPEGFVDRPSPLGPIALVAASGAIGLAVARRSNSGPAWIWLAAALVGCAAAWGTAPDTEPALIGGAVVLAAGLTLGRAAARWAPTVLIVPGAAAVIGTVGRPDRLPLVLMLVAGGMSVALASGVLVYRWFRSRQRAGTPTTVAPGATSMVTTAPAPTTAP